MIFAGPPASYTAGGTSSAAAFALTAGATGNYQQPVLRGLLLQQGRSNQVISVEGFIVVSGTTATTLTLTVGTATTPNQSSLGGTMLTFPAMTVSSFSSGGVWFKSTTINRGFGYGTSSVATNLQTYGQWAAQGNSLGTAGAAPVTQLATIDGSVNQWITILGQFSGSSGTNSAQLTQLIVRGEN